MSNLYEHNQAFEKAFEHCKNLTDLATDKWNKRHLNYSSNPEKLKKLSTVTIIAIYNIWFEELYTTSQELINKLNEVNTNIANSKTNWLGFFKRKRKINNYFNELYDLGNVLNAFKKDCFEFQRCILATDFMGKNDDAEILQEQIRYIDLIESRITQTGDRKLTSINNSRMQFFGLVLSITAIVVSLVSLFAKDFF